MQSSTPRWTKDRLINLAFFVVVSALTLVVVGILVGSWWKWNHEPQNPVTIPPQNQSMTTVPTTPARSSAASSLPTLTATSVPESQIGDVGAGGSSTTPSSSASTSPTNEGQRVVYRVISDTSAAITYRSATGKSFTYSMQPGRWQIVAPGGGRIEAKSSGRDAHGAVRCETADKATGRTLSEDSSFRGAVECGSA